ncbi:MAG: heavy metal translocating P-type ATPase [Rhodothermales bacterium]
MVEKIKLDVSDLLPDVPDERDQCVRLLIDSLGAKKGIDRLHVVESADNDPARICIHYDPTVVTLAQIKRIAIRTGVDLTERFGHVLWKTAGISHERRARNVTRMLAPTAGVIEAEATAAGFVRIEFDRNVVNESKLRAELNRMHVRIEGDDVSRQRDRTGPRTQLDRDDHDHKNKGHKHGGGGKSGTTGIRVDRLELVFAILAGSFVLSGWLLASFTAVAPAIAVACFVAAYLFGGFFTVREAYESVRSGRFEIDTLMLIAAAGAAALGKWNEGALLLFLFSIGHALEHYAMGRARRAIEALAELAPKTAVVRRAGVEHEIPVEELVIGDVVIVRTNERLPADGFVAKGTSSVNQAPVTGESIPVDKQPVVNINEASKQWETLGSEFRVFAGTINGAGALEVVVIRLPSQSTLAHVVRMVAEAETQQSPTQRFTDQFERIFVPAVIAFVVLLLFAWVVVDETFATSFYRAMAVLVAASPCALAIATPSAVLSGIARAGRGGVLIKGGGPLENLGTLKSIAFDKTGTLTEGKPRVTDVVPADGVTEDYLLRTAIAVEKLSDHPLATAVVRYGVDKLGNQSIEAAESAESITGKGIKAQLGSDTVYIGKDGLFVDELQRPPAGVLATVERLENEGRTTMIVQRGAEFLGVLGLMDTPRDVAATVIDRLRRIGIRRMIMISGDNQRVADSIAKAVGLDEARGDLMPNDKVETIKALGKEGKVAMVGDGVNDAPAMAYATVGIAMGAAGSDVALETADVALMADDLRHLPFAVGLSRQASRIIRQNLWMSLGMVAFLIPATLFGLGIGPAVALHEGSTLVVVVNALRLLAYAR